VARVRNWPLVPGGGQLRSHVLVDVALGVRFRHRHQLQEIGPPWTGGRSGDRETRVLHVAGKSRAIAAKGAQEGEHALATSRTNLWWRPAV